MTDTKNKRSRERIGIVEVLLIVSIISISALVAIRLPLIFAGGHDSFIYTASSSQASFAATGYDPSLSSTVTNSELGVAGNGGGESNFWYNEKFIPGQVTYNGPGSPPSCYAENLIIPPGLVWSSCAFKILGHCIPGPVYESGSTQSTYYNNLVGYIGYPTEDSGAGSFKPFARCGYDFPNLVSGVPGFTLNPTSIYYCPSPPSNITYANYFDWQSTPTHILNYTGSQYLYAVNTNLYVPPYGNGPGPALPAGTTLIIPSVSCGATFPNNYINAKPLVGNIPDIQTLSGFTPSVGLAANGGAGWGVTYVAGQIGGGQLQSWPAVNSLEAYQYQSIDQAFPSNYPTLNYAHFPGGNKGDSQYINVSEFFEAPTNIGIFAPLSSGGNSTILVTNVTIASLHSYIVDNTIAKTSINAYVPFNYESMYYPQLGSGLLSNLYTYDYFRTDGIFPLCAASVQNGAVSIDSTCTFENPSSINPVSYGRFWTSNTATLTVSNNPYDRFSYDGAPLNFISWSALYMNALNLQPFMPGYDTLDSLNYITNDTLKSFCFYNESFNTATGVYTPPSYTRVIPPLASENYTASIGQCNAFYNNTDCFNPVFRQYLNFEDGIFIHNIKCTTNGILPQNVTDGWISSAYIANDAGQFCGYFGGQKNASNPTANSTVFLRSAYDCPTFDANGQSANLVITVKNVGNTYMYNPYLVALFRDTNISQMFYSSQQSQSSEYSEFTTFLGGMQSSGNTGVLEVRYNSTFQTDMYYYKSGYPLNPVPIQSLFTGTYENGPYNNSLLGLWLYHPVSGGPKVVRTSNTLLIHSSSNDSGVPIIAPNGTATFTIQIPMPLLEALVESRLNVSIYFGDLMNVSWSIGEENKSSPTQTIYAVSPAVASGTQNQTDIHNNEILNSLTNPSTGTTSPSPLWQYLASTNLNFSRAPFSNISITTINLSVSVYADNNTNTLLYANPQPQLTTVNGSGTYYTGSSPICYSGNCQYSPLHPIQLPMGSSISCFASQDNINDFSVLWSTQVVSPPNLQYAVQNFYAPNGQVDNLLVTRWRGLVFMPYADQTILNYDNLPEFPQSIASMLIERPTINQTTNIYSTEAFAYFGTGSESTLFDNLNSIYSFLHSTPAMNFTQVPSSIYGFTLVANGLAGNGSVIRISAIKTLLNSSAFSGKQVTIGIVNSGTQTTCQAGQTRYDGLLNASQTSNPCLASAMNDATVNKSYMVITSASGPFSLQLYNSSTINMSNLSQYHITFISSNITNSTLHAGQYEATLNISRSIANGFSLIFQNAPITQPDTQSYVYLYYLNDTPFSCDVVNNIFSIKDNAVTYLGPGEYATPNGTILCYVRNTFSALRAVFMNQSNRAYLGSGDLGLGLVIQNYSTYSKNTLLLTYNGVPLNSQDVNMSTVASAGVSPCTIVSKQIINNGILNFGNSNCKVSAGGNYTLNFTQTVPTSQSSTASDQVLRSFLFRNISVGKPNCVYLHNHLVCYLSDRILGISPVAASDNPLYTANLTITPVPYAAPVVFSMPLLGQTCDNIRVLGDYPYPYAEIPYQAVRAGNNCLYTFVEDGHGHNNYIIFAGEAQPQFPYSTSWLSYSATPYSYNINTPSYSGTLVGNCDNKLGPCVYGFNFAGQNVGNLLVNNVSASQATISQTVSGPVEDCFEVTYSASEQVVWRESGFGNLNYNSNKLYQMTNPTQQVSSSFCFFNGAPLITDYVSSSGNPLWFEVQNSLTSDFSYAQANGGQSFYVPPPISVGYNGYASVSEYQQSVKDQTIQGENYLLQRCATVTTPQSAVLGHGVVISPAVYANSYNPPTNGYYCMFGGIPTYTTEAGANNNYVNPTTGETINYLYQPGTYNITPQGSSSSEIYNDCSLTRLITTATPSNPTQSLPGGSTLHVDLWPLVEVNGTWQQYNPNNPSESTIASYTAPAQNIFDGEDIIFSSSGATNLINQCAPNETIENYTACIAPLPNPPITLQNGSYDGIEGIPNRTIGNYNKSNGNYGPADYIGGGCLINTAYSCAPTNGMLSLNLPSGALYSGAISSASASVSFSKNVYESSGNMILTSDISFNCNGWYANQSGGPHIKNTSISCSYGNAGNYCSASFSNGPNSASPTGWTISATCSVSGNPPGAVESGMRLSSLSIGASESNPTGLLNNQLCGNISDFIGQNIQNGIASQWKPYATKHDEGGYALAEVGGCEAVRDMYNLTQPNISNVRSKEYPNENVSLYSCPTGYSGTIESCAAVSSTTTTVSASPNANCANTLAQKLISGLSPTLINGRGNGGQPLGCNEFSQSGNPNFSTPTVADGCIAYHSGISTPINTSYILQYSNSSDNNPPIGLGLAVINKSVPANVSIPSSASIQKNKDQYASGLSVSQYEAKTIMTDLGATNLLLSNTPSAALFKSSIYSYDLLNIITLQNPYFGVSGIPAFENGSIYDYATSLFTGGTSSNCAGGINANNSFSLFDLGEGQLCSGRELPSNFPNGVYFSLGSLNEGLHAVQLYSISETGNTSEPSINLQDTVGTAYSLNSPCANGNSRVFTSTYSGGKWVVTINSDEECTNINNQLYGYIVNCMYQTPGNATYATASEYYLAYNLPTIWNISYTLLVSPKSYNIIPVPVYTVNASFGAYLSLYPHYLTKFVETGLPIGVTWFATLGTQSSYSNTNQIKFISGKGPNSYTIPTLRNMSSSANCTTTYRPSPASGVESTAGGTINVTFSGSTLCYTTFVFKKGDLADTQTWWADFNNVNESASTADNITFVTPEASAYNANWGIDSLSCGSGASVLVGSTVTPSWTCTTTFEESGLPASGEKWNVSYGNEKSSVPAPQPIAFSNPLPYSSDNYIIKTIFIKDPNSLKCYIGFIPSPSSGTAEAGAMVQVSFTEESISCPNQ